MGDRCASREESWDSQGQLLAHSLVSQWDLCWKHFHKVGQFHLESTTQSPRKVEVAISCSHKDCWLKINYFNSLITGALVGIYNVQLYTCTCVRV